jgi:RNase H-fold protein (predicted Holliday junction resolvase)
MDGNKPAQILGIVPGRRVVGFAVLDETGLKSFGVKSLRRFDSDSQRLLAFNRFLCSVINSIKPRAVVVLKPSPQKSTSFNLQLISFIRGLANSRYCPIYYLSIKQVKTVLGSGRKLSNQREVARVLRSSYPELEYYMPDTESKVIKDREKYYQPLFSAIGLALSYLKLSENEQQPEDNQTKP